MQTSPTSNLALACLQGHMHYEQYHTTLLLECTRQYCCLSALTDVIAHVMTHHYLSKDAYIICREAVPADMACSLLSWLGAIWAMSSFGLLLSSKTGESWLSVVCSLGLAIGELAAV